MKSNLSGYGDYQKLTRRSVSLELFKFVGDYHGFAPFVGLSASLEKLQVLELILSEVHEHESEGVHPGIVFGWDIRPNDIQSWYLRTNLRWYPTLELDTHAESRIDFSQLEFNFIQLVIFPNRLF